MPGGWEGMDVVEEEFLSEHKIVIDRETLAMECRCGWKPWLGTNEPQAMSGHLFKEARKKVEGLCPVKQWDPLKERFVQCEQKKDHRPRLHTHNDMMWNWDTPQV